MSARSLIVNADDFGLSPGVNRGVARAHEEGILTSASLMVRSEHAAEAVAYARARPLLSVGLHVDLDPWRYAVALADGARAAAPQLDDADAVRAEIEAQLERFRALTGGEPTHLDSHHHLHLAEPSRTVVLELGRRLGVPVRGVPPGPRYEGGFFARGVDGAARPQAIAPETLCALLRALPPGVTELGCHPAIEDESGSSYGSERTVETATLCDPRVRRALRDEDVALRSFRDRAAGA